MYLALLMNTTCEEVLAHSDKGVHSLCKNSWKEPHDAAHQCHQQCAVLVTFHGLHQVIVLMTRNTNKKSLTHLSSIISGTVQRSCALHRLHCQVDGKEMKILHEQRHQQCARDTYFMACIMSKHLSRSGWRDDPDQQCQSAL